LTRVLGVDYVVGRLLHDDDGDLLHGGDHLLGDTVAFELRQLVLHQFSKSLSNIFQPCWPYPVNKFHYLTLQTLLRHLLVPSVSAVDQVHVGRFFVEIYDRELEVHSISSELYTVWMEVVCS
jgi:hypothetical protein